MLSYSSLSKCCLASAESSQLLLNPAGRSGRLRRQLPGLRRPHHRITESLAMVSQHFLINEFKLNVKVQQLEMRLDLILAQVKKRPNQMPQILT